MIGALRREWRVTAPGFLAIAVVLVRPDWGCTVIRYGSAMLYGVLLAVPV